MTPITSALQDDRAPAVAAAYGRARRTLWIVVAVAIGLLATHLGEFWPFSIYPMFSRAGRPFHRAIVRELQAGEGLPLEENSLDSLPGRPFALAPAGLDQNDLANMVAKTEVWTEARANALYHTFARHAARKRLVVYAVRGELVDGGAGGVAVSYRPVIELSPAGPRPLPK